MTEATDWENYQTGPFCLHWSDPIDCEIKCTSCGHECRYHAHYDDNECRECGCKEFKDSEQTGDKP